MRRARRDEQLLQQWKQDSDAARQTDSRKRAEDGAAARAEQADAPAGWPPPTAHAPMAECLVCGSDDLVETRDSALMMSVKDRPDANYVAYPTLLNIVVCRHCGHLEFFANEVRAFLSAYHSTAQTPRSLPPVVRHQPARSQVLAGDGDSAPSLPPTQFAIPVVPPLQSDERPSAKSSSSTTRSATGRAARGAKVSDAKDEIDAAAQQAARRIEKIDRGK